MSCCPPPYDPEQYPGRAAHTAWAVLAVLVALASILIMLFLL